MQLLPMYLALFFGTLLTTTTTTDAAPRGSNRDDDSRSLDRIRMLMMESKYTYVEGNTAVVRVVGKNGGKKPKGPDSTFPDAEIITCNMLEAFDNMGHDENKLLRADGQVKWRRLCDDFDSFDQMVCPDADAVAAICASRFPKKNPAIKNAWCIPVYGMMEPVERRDECIKYCTNYVSADRGGCCDIDCGGGGD
jgi:hypothetical protein